MKILFSRIVWNKEKYIEVLALIRHCKYKQELIIPLSFSSQTISITHLMDQGILYHQCDVKDRFFCSISCSSDRDYSSFHRNSNIREEED